MSIIEFTLDKWRIGRRIKKSPSGFESGNAVCCIHRNQSLDKRGRGGMIVSGNTLSYSCFNCSYKCSYTIGRPLYPKFINLLRWMDVDEKIINQLKLEALRESSQTTSFPTHSNQPKNIKAIELPKNCTILEDDKTNQAHVDFLKTRGFTPEDFSFLVSSDLVYRSRIILPFIMHDTIIGYSARSIISSEKIRYIMKTTTNFIFGMEWVKPEHNIVFVMEGLFDAMSIGGLAVMHNEISDAQIEMLCDLQKKIIIVPDLDKTGLLPTKNGLIQIALDNGWGVSFPEWEKIKDVNDAYVKYGPLFTMKHLIDMTTTDPLTIRLKQKLLLQRFK